VDPAVARLAGPGTLAQNGDFVATLHQALTAMLLSRRLDLPEELTSVRVLFADDIGPARVVHVVFLPESGALPSAHGAWIATGRGATAGTLADEYVKRRTARDATFVESSGLQPFAAVDLPLAAREGGKGSVAVGLAPDGCRVASNVAGNMDWRFEPTGSYIVRRPTDPADHHLAGWWRVSCDGVVRHEGPAPMSLLPGRAGPTDEEVDRAVTGTRGVVNRRLAREHLGTVVMRWGNAALAPPRVVWMGRVPDVAGPPW
jgi:hypothetical protein